MKRKPNIAAVAQKAGVAKSTVSRFLNGGSVSARMRLKVAGVIEATGYYPSVTARNFAKNRSGSLGLVVEGTESDWMVQILAGIEAASAQDQVSVLLGSLYASGEYDASTIELWIREHRVDGLIFARAGHRQKPLISGAQKAGIPVAVIGPDLDFGYGNVIGAENRQAGKDIAEHLVALGHRHIAFMGGPADSLDSQDRLGGIQSVLARQNIEIANTDIQFRTYTVDSGREYAAIWMKMPKSQRPSAVIFGNDESALGFMRVVQEAGVKIPADVSVAGFDDVRAAGLHWPGLTTSAQPGRDMGAAACKAVLLQVQNETQENRPPQRFPTSLVIRESTGPFT